jgi:hypothetical protein
VSGHLLAAHVAHATHGSGFAQYIPYLVPLVIGLVIGRIWGRSAGLKHLGAYEYQNRWKGVRSVRRF